MLRRSSCNVRLDGPGRDAAQYDNTVTISKWRKDAWGIPAPHLRLIPSENERNMVRCEMDTIKEMARACGYDIDLCASLLGMDDPSNSMKHDSWFTRTLFKMTYKKSLEMGSAIHECGGARMGSDPGKSVSTQQPTMGREQRVCNRRELLRQQRSLWPTLTTMALTTRACEYIAKEYGKTI